MLVGEVGAMKSVEAVVTLRAKNQLTLPEAIAERLGVEPGDRLVVAIDDEHPTKVEVRPLLRSYAGVLKGVYGTEEERAAYLAEERASWDQ